MIDDLLISIGFTKVSPPDSSIIKKVKTIFDFIIPSDYQKYLTDFSQFEDNIGKEYVALWKGEQLIQSNIEYEIQVHLPKIFGIGSNGGGELIGINMESKEIILCPFLGFSEENFIKIGDSFTDFLVRLKNEKEWFN